VAEDDAESEWSEWAESPRSDAPQRTPYDPRPAHDRVRAWLTGALVALLAVTVLLIFCLIDRHKTIGIEVSEVADATTPIFTALITLVGTATGFYFGGRMSAGPGA
jgi:hypothetical protein